MPRETIDSDAEALGRILEESLNEVFVFDAETLRFVLVNRRARENLGYSLEELRQLTPLDLKPRFDAHSFEALIAPLRSGRRSVLVFETEHRRRDGSEYDVEGHLQTTESGGRSCFVAIMLDVSGRVEVERALHDRDERLQAVLNTAADAIITIDEVGIVQNANPASERMFGHEASALIGRNVSMLMPSPYREEHDGYLRNYRETGEARIIGIGREVVAIHADGHEFPIDLAVSSVDHLGLFTGVIRDISERRRLQEHLLTIAAEEQRWIGHELHDGVGQELAGLGMMADTLVALADGGKAPSPEMARSLAKGLRSANDQVRALARGLTPVEVDARGLITALAGLGRQIEERAGVTWTLEAPEEIPLLDGPTCGHLYRIAQEATNNAVRHGNPTRLAFTISVEERLLTLQILDDGTGLAESAGSSEGLGMRIMQYRAGIVGGRLRVQNAPAGGVSVACSVPIVSR